MGSQAAVKPGLGVAAALTSVLLWGTQLPLAKLAMLQMDPFTLSLLRYALAVMVLAAILLWREGSSSFSLGGRARISWLAALGLSSSAVIVFIGLSLTRSEVAVVIIQLQPTMIALVEWKLQGRKPGRFTLVCMALAFFGVLFAVTQGGVGIADLLKTNPRELLGDFLVWLGTVGWVIYTLAAVRLSGWSSLRLATITCSQGLVLVAVGWAIAWLAGLIRWPDTAALLSVAGPVLHVSLLGVVVAMFSWNVAVRHVGSLNAMLLLHLMPVVTFAHRALEGASISWAEQVGAAIVIGALVANNLAMRRRAVSV
jgi:drug/metabolite transporter (DMT)-like permease